MGQQESTDEPVPVRRLKSRTVQGVAEFIKEGKAPRIVVLTGAGVSTSAGIPDFRSPNTGLYANLTKFNLPYPEAVFDISYFRENPGPFYALTGELHPGRYKPTVAHSFIALLARKGLLHMLFTQNIDCLDRAAGVPEERIVEAHGTWATQKCVECRAPFPDDLMKTAIENGSVPQCARPNCGGFVKPDVVFFGEPLPSRFFKKTAVIAEADLVIVMGTSLMVEPFASLPEFVPEGVPRVLINLEMVGRLGCRMDDFAIMSECDAGVRRLADCLGWRAELEALWREVSGQEAVGEIVEDTRTKDEKLQDEIKILTQDVDDTLQLAKAHQQNLQDHVLVNRC
jgi:NAD-dependent histone deacetylase SIR2